MRITSLRITVLTRHANLALSPVAVHSACHCPGAKISSESRRLPSECTITFDQDYHGSLGPKSPLWLSTQCRIDSACSMEEPVSSRQMCQLQQLSSIFVITILSSSSVSKKRTLLTSNSQALHVHIFDGVVQLISPGGGIAAGTDAHLVEFKQKRARKESDSLGICFYAPIFSTRLQCCIGTLALLLLSATMFVEIVEPPAIEVQFICTWLQIS